MRRLFVTVIGFLLVAPITFGQMPDLDPERRAQLERRGAGLQIGAWLPGNLPEVADAEYSVTPLFTGFFRHGLDRHLAWENTVSFWMRRQSREFTDITGATREERVTTAIVPLLTSLTFYPATGPEATVEPFIRGGVGFVLGVDNRRGTSGGLFGIAGQEGTVMFTGVGARGGLGVDARLSRVFGLTAAAQYQWVHFLEGEPGGQATYHGPAIEVGLIYRFQFSGERTFTAEDAEVRRGGGGPCRCPRRRRLTRSREGREVSLPRWIQTKAVGRCRPRNRD